jgi:hypothetical protein
MEQTTNALTKYSKVCLKKEQLKYIWQKLTGQWTLRGEIN